LISDRHKGIAVLLRAGQIVDGKALGVPIEAAKIVGTLSQQALDTHVRLREIDRDLNTR
jgi:transposase